ncbi:hypothetical protein GGR53DRAFT_471907 [Hypoxylon sp. FL1150]|nr:hypothetical protein GGR53DRAFT_471907 [Hypoxylon sp. FL1150]
MAVSDLQMPSFGFTESEKVDNDIHVLSLLDQCAALLDTYRQNASTLDLDDALFAVNEATMLAEDPDACESPPLARCYLYKGHVLRATERYVEASAAYLRATHMPSNNPIDSAAAEQAAPLAREMDRKIRDAKRKGGIWQPGSQSSGECVAWPKKAVSPYAFPPCQQVRRNQPRVVDPQLQNTLEPQGLVESGGVWTPKPISTISRREKIRAGLRCLVQDALARGAQDYFTIRVVT